MPGWTGWIRVLGVFLKLDRPLDYGSVDKSPVDLVFALLAPRDAGVDHLKALAFVSRTLRNPAVCEKLRANDEPGEIHRDLVERRRDEGGVRADFLNLTRGQ